MNVMPLPYAEARKVPRAMWPVSIGLRRAHARTLRHGPRKESYGRWWAIWPPYTPEWCKAEYWGLIRRAEK